MKNRKMGRKTRSEGREGEQKASKWEGCKMLISLTYLAQETVGTEGTQQLVR